MALVEKFEQLTMDRNSVHGLVRCTYSVFSDGNGNRYLQLDTYGSATRKIGGKKSQSLQLDQKAIDSLCEILRSEGFL